MTTSAAGINTLGRERSEQCRRRYGALPSAGSGKVRQGGRVNPHACPHYRLGALPTLTSPHVPQAPGYTGFHRKSCNAKPKAAGSNICVGPATRAARTLRQVIPPRWYPMLFRAISRADRVRPTVLSIALPGPPDCQPHACGNLESGRLSLTRAKTDGYPHVRSRLQREHGSLILSHQKVQDASGIQTIPATTTPCSSRGCWKVQSKKEKCKTIRRNQRCLTLQRMSRPRGCAVGACQRGRTPTEPLQDRLSLRKKHGCP